MNSSSPKIYFYLSQLKNFLDHIPNNVDTYLPFLKKLGISDGEYAWIIQTYLNLKNDGYDCELTDQIPDEGILLAHYNSLPFFFRPPSRLLLIYLKADKLSMPYAQLQVVQNSYDEKQLANSYYMPHWIIPGLIPRDCQRGQRFENIGYFGTTGNIAPELRGMRGKRWEDALADIGLKWKFKQREEWNNYSDIDAVLAVRQFRNLAGSWTQDGGAWKPPTKLYNAWLAGVPAILGNEPAYRDQRENEFSYIEVNSQEEIFTQLQRLRDDIEFRNAIVEQGKKQVRHFTKENTIEKWKKFLIEVAIPEYERWANMSWLNQKSFFLKRYIGSKSRGLKRRTHALLRNISAP